MNVCIKVTHVYMPGIIYLRTTLIVFHPRATNGFSNPEIEVVKFKDPDHIRDIMIDLFGRRID